MRKTVFFALTLLLLCLAVHAFASDDRILVFIETGTGFETENNGQRILPGEDAVFTLTMDRGVLLTGTDYTGETDISTENRTVTLTLKNVRYPARVRLYISTKSCTVTYDANGGGSLSGETAVAKRYGTTVHPRPNTENGRELFFRDGFTLLCWNTRSDGKGERVGLGSRVTPVNGEARLYAQWVRWADPADFAWEGGETVTITGYHGMDEQLVIPAELDGVPVDSIAAGAFKGCTARQIVLPDGLKTVEDGAFSNCANLTEVTLFDNIESISDGAFADCPELKTLYINAAEAPYGYVYRKESVYADKVEMMIAAQGRPKLVFYGGCSMWYNLDALQAVKAFGDSYAVINMGLNGTVSSAVQLQILAPYLEEGDILFHTPEVSSKLQLMISPDMGDNDSSLWTGIENNYDLFALVDLRTVGGVFDSLCHYLGMKDKRADYQQFFSDDYRTPYIDAYGSIPFYRSGTKKELADSVSLNPELLADGMLDTLRQYYAWLTGKGIRILVSHACVNMDAVPEEQRGNTEIMDALFRERLDGLPGVSVISCLSDYIYQNSDFYDTNYHLCSEPAKANTARWLEDLSRALNTEEAADCEE